MSPPFQYQPVQYPMAGVIPQLMEQGGQIQANALLQAAQARAQGQIGAAQAWGQGLGNLANLVGNAPGMYAQQQEAKTRAQEAQLNQQLLTFKMQQAQLSQKYTNLALQAEKDLSADGQIPSEEQVIRYATGKGIPLDYVKDYLGNIKDISNRNLENEADIASMVYRNVKGLGPGATPDQRNATVMSTLGAVRAMKGMSSEAVDGVSQFLASGGDPIAGSLAMMARSARYKETVQDETKLIGTGRGGPIYDPANRTWMIPPGGVPGQQPTGRELLELRSLGWEPGQPITPELATAAMKGLGGAGRPENDFTAYMQAYAGSAGTTPEGKPMTWEQLSPQQQITGLTKWRQLGTSEAMQAARLQHEDLINVLARNQVNTQRSWTPEEIDYFANQVKVDGTVSNMIPKDIKERVLQRVADLGGNINRITQQTRAMSEMAKEVLPHITTIQAEARQLDQLGLLGPIGARWRDFLTRKVGAGELAGGNAQNGQLVGKFQTDVGLLKTAVARTHGGARGGGSFQMLEHMNDLLGADKADLPTLMGQLDGFRDWMQGYAAMVPGGTAGTPSTGTPSNLPVQHWEIRDGKPVKVGG